ncbi:hypothetical protein EJMOOK_05750 [Rhodanobacter sp. Root179]
MVRDAGGCLHCRWGRVAASPVGNGRALCAMPLLCLPAALRAKAFVCLRQPSHLSLCGQRNVAQREATPLPRLADVLSARFASRGRAFRQGILPWRKGADIPVGSRYAACRPRLAAAEGPRVERRASCAYFSEEPDQEQSCGNPELLLLPFSFITKCALGARCFTGAPMARRAGGGKAPQGWPAGMPASSTSVHGWTVGEPP